MNEVRMEVRKNRHMLAWETWKNREYLYEENDNKNGLYRKQRTQRTDLMDNVYCGV